MKFFCFLSLFTFSTAFAKPCGLEGSIEERIKDCASLKGNFALVTATEKGIEIYKDIKSGLLWGSRISVDFNHYGSQKACKDEISGYEVLDSLKWRLPTIKEFKEASAHGITNSLPSMEHGYWSSTPFRIKRSRRRRSVLAGAYIWDGSMEKPDHGGLKDGASVRCVARE